MMINGSVMKDTKPLSLSLSCAAHLRSVFRTFFDVYYRRWQGKHPARQDKFLSVEE